MAYQLNSKLENLTPYEPICCNHAIRLDANESFIKIDESFVEDIHKKLLHLNFNRYPDPYAVELCKRFAEFYELDEQYVTAGNGSDELLFIIISAFLKKGEKILTLSPDFSMYNFYAALTEVEIIDLKKEEDLSIHVDKLIHKAKEENVRMIVFSNPCNPTSLGISREDVKKIIKSTSALVVLDEAYMDFWNQSLIEEADKYENLILLRTCSKAIGLAAARLGFAVANETLTRAIKTAKSPYNVNAISQLIGETILLQKGYLKRAVSKIISSKNQFEASLIKLSAGGERFKVFESCTNFVLLKTKRAKDCYEELLKRGIVVRCFDDYLRVTAGSLIENAQFIAEFEEILD